MFALDHGSSTPIYEQIMRQIKMLCLKQAFRPGDKLPSVRELSGLIVANPNTVSKAYQALEREGVIETRPGKGTFVSAVQPDRIIDPNRVAMLKQQVGVLALDAHFIGVKPQQLKTWIDEHDARWGGATDARGQGVIEAD